MRNTHPLLMLYEALCANEGLGAAGAAGHVVYGEAPGCREGVPQKSCSAAEARVLLFPLAEANSSAGQPHYAVVVCTNEDACVYLVEPRLSYWVQFASMTAGQQDAWHRDLREHRLAPFAQALQKYGANSPDGHSCSCSAMAMDVASGQGLWSDKAPN